MKIINIIKYIIVRFVETKPLINLIIMNNIRFVKFLLPHDKDYLGMSLICNNEIDSVIVDVGGNVGTSILSFRKLGFINKIYVFEPNEYLVENYLNKLKVKDSNISIFNYGLGNENISQNFYLPYYKNKCLHYFVSFSKQYIQNSINITFPKLKNKIIIKEKKFNFKRFDDIDFPIKPHFIKIDAEGFEHEILLGMIQTIKKFKPFFLIEYNEDNFSLVCNILSEYFTYRYDISQKNFNKITKNHINEYFIGRNSKQNKLSSRNIYFLPEEI